MNSMLMLCLLQMMACAGSKYSLNNASDTNFGIV